MLEMVHAPFENVFIFLTVLTICTIWDYSGWSTTREGMALEFHYDFFHYDNH